jgi:hypothetical protein
LVKLEKRVLNFNGDNRRWDTWKNNTWTNSSVTDLARTMRLISIHQSSIKNS